MFLLVVLLVVGCASALNINELDGTLTTYSQCHPEVDCQAAVTGNGTGHELYHNLTNLLVDAERCYSFCFRNVRADRVGRVAQS